MSTKALKKQLMAAIAMVLVAAIALGSSTYAWFANNNTVTAEGMEITAQAEGTMLIIADTKANLSTKQTSLVLSPATTGTLYPTHPATAVKGATAEGSAISVWNHRYSKSFTQAIDATADSEVAINTGDLSNYVLTQTIAIGIDTSANTSAATGAVTVTSVSITGADADFLPCARVALVNEAGNLIGVYAPEHKYVSTFNTETAADELTAMGAGHGTVISALNSTTPSTQITAYIYFDGRDAACTSEKIDFNKVSVSLEFTAADA